MLPIFFEADYLHLQNVNNYSEEELAENVDYKNDVNETKGIVIL